MTSEKFVYTVSGVALSAAQKSKISQEIAAVVARVVLGESPAEVRPELLTLHGVAGGRMIPTAEAVKAKATEAFISGGCGGGGTLT
jgi:hypothetical protein